jgi:hypothetical protein
MDERTYAWFYGLFEKYFKAGAGKPFAAIIQRLDSNKRLRMNGKQFHNIVTQVVEWVKVLRSQIIFLVN